MDIYWVVVAFQLLSPVCFSLQHHGLQHARLPCPSKSPRVYLNSCPLGFPLCSAGKESICNTEDPCLISWFDPWDGKIPWRRERPPIPVFWPGEFHRLQIPWGHKESDTPEGLSFSLCEKEQKYERAGSMTQ